MPDRRDGTPLIVLLTYVIPLCVVVACLWIAAVGTIISIVRSIL